METHLGFLGNFLPAIFGQAMIHPTPGGGPKTRTQTPSSTGAWDVAHIDFQGIFLGGNELKPIWKPDLGMNIYNLQIIFGPNYKVPGCCQALTHNFFSAR